MTEHETTPALLRVEGLNVWFELKETREFHAVRGVSFELRQGEVLGLVGESGGGKTTTLLSLLGLLPPNASVAGGVYLRGENLFARGEQSVVPHRWTDIALVVQGAMNAFSPVHSIGRQIIEPMELHGVASGKRAERRAGDLLEAVGIPPDRADWFPHEFSGGMRQRAAIAMALACDPKILLADEPTTALDVITQGQILDLLVRLAQERDLALILATHDLGLVGQTCDRTAVMYAGELAELGPSEDVYHDPKHPYTRLLFEATPDLHQANRFVTIPGSPPRLDEKIVGCPFAPRCDRTLKICLTVPASRISVGTDREAACHLNSSNAADSVSVVSAVKSDRDSLAATLRANEPHQVAAKGAELLEAVGLEVSYPLPRGIVGTLLRRPRREVRAVDGVSLSVCAGETLALVGETGSGKTTTALSIVRLVDPSAGQIRFMGEDLRSLAGRRLRRIRAKLAFVHQDPYESLDPRFRVSETLEEPLVVQKLAASRSERRERVEAALHRVGLTPAELYLSRYPHELSGGQRQRIAIAAALISNPRLLIADEPVSMLDVSVRAGILELLYGLRRDGLGILMITHDLATAGVFADRIAVMYLGRIVESGPARDVLHEPKHPYTKALVSAIPSVDPRRRFALKVLSGEVPNPASLPSGCRFHPRCPEAIEACRTIDPEARPHGADHWGACIHIPEVDGDPLEAPEVSRITPSA